MRIFSLRAAQMSILGPIALLGSQAAAEGERLDIPFKPSNFSHPLRIDNKFFKLTPGTTQFFRARSAEEGCETIRTTTTNDTKQVDGITTRVVHDVSFEDPRCNNHLTKAEDTLDYFAQDNAGNVWYMGEKSKDCEDGKCTLNDGSWTAGKDIFNTGKNAKPGIQMLAHPHVGDSYRQELYLPNAADEAKVAAVGVTVKLNRENALPPKNFTGCVKIKEFSAVEPGVTEFKYYCPGVGLVLGTEQPGNIRTERIKEPEDDALKFRTAP